jgi:flagellar L-ring protein precursor FlgH
VKTVSLLVLLVLSVGLNTSLMAGLHKSKQKEPEPSMLDKYVTGATSREGEPADTAPGALWSPSARLTDMARDLRASQVDDVVTIIVSESTNAVAKGTSSAARTSSASASVNALAGPKGAASALANLAKLSGNTKLDGQGATTRQSSLTATLTARVVSVLPGGLLLIEGGKNILVNSEQQAITVRGVIRTADISTLNTVPSTRIADVEIKVNGKGVVGDAVRRPNILYRILLGVLPF